MPHARLAQISLARVNGDPRLRPSVDGEGFAFPKYLHPEQPPPRRLEGSAFQPARRRTRASALPGKPQAFRKAGRQSRSEDRRCLLIWAAVAQRSRVRAPDRGAGVIVCLVRRLADTGPVGQRRAIFLGVPGPVLQAIRVFAGSTGLIRRFRGRSCRVPIPLWRYRYRRGYTPIHWQ